MRAADAATGFARFRAVAAGVAWRSLHNFLTNPALLIPALLFPLFFFTAFAGGLSRVDQAPGFDYPNGYTAFEFAFVILQASAFGGVFTGFGIARDFETGFGRRLMLAAPNRYGIVAGYALSALVRAAIVGALLFAIALLAGMEVSRERRAARRADRARPAGQRRRGDVVGAASPCASARSRPAR